MTGNTLLLRLEGPLQAWGDQQSKFVIRHTAEAPTKSGIAGLLCAALGVDRRTAAAEWLGKLASLQMGVRVDRPGIRWWDYHTVGGGQALATAEGGWREESLLTRREYLCDASFLVALQGNPDLIAQLESALQRPHWTLYLGKKSCPPARPVLESAPDTFPDVTSALVSVPWRPRLKGDSIPQTLTSLVDWASGQPDSGTSPETEVWFDVPLSFDPPAHAPRIVRRRSFKVGSGLDVTIDESPIQSPPPPLTRPRADYKNQEYRERRRQRLEADHGLCVFCKSPANTVQHITYRRAGGKEQLEDLRALCRLCHDAVTMVEYGHGMGLDRIDPGDLRWREEILQRRTEILRFRSQEVRRRRLAYEEGL